MSHDSLSNSPTPFDGASPGATTLSEQEIADRLTAARLLGQIDEEEPIAPRAPVRNSDWATAIGGFSGGMAANLLLGFVVLFFQRAGVPIYGPGLLALIVGALGLILVLGTWTRRVVCGVIGFTSGLVLTFAALWWIVGPIVRTSMSSVAPLPAVSTPAPASDDAAPINSS